MTLPQCKSLRCMPPKGSSSRSSTSRSVGRALAASTRRRSCCTTRRDGRILDVGGQEGPGYNARKTVAEAEEAGEELRLLYVALTRAQCQLVLWWAPSYGTSRSPLHRLMLGRTPGIAEPARVVKVLDDGTTAARLATWPAAASDVISVEPVGPHPPSPVHWSRAAADVTELAAARFDRDLDTLWRRTSYSALTAGAHHAVTNHGQ